MTSLPKLLTLAAALIALSTTACTTIRELPTDPADVELSPEVQEERDFSRKLLEAFLKDDESKFISLLTPEMQEEFRKDKAAYSRFRKVILEERGEPVSFRYVTSLESAVLKPYIWKIRFLHKNNKDQEFYREALFRVVIGHIEDLKKTDDPEYLKMEKKASDKDNGLYIFSFNFL